MKREKQEAKVRAEAEERMGWKILNFIRDLKIQDEKHSARMIVIMELSNHVTNFKFDLAKNFNYFEKKTKKYALELLTACLQDNRIKRENIEKWAKKAYSWRKHPAKKSIFRRTTRRTVLSVRVHYRLQEMLTLALTAVKKYPED